MGGKWAEHEQKKDWRVMFPEDLLKTAEGMVQKGYVSQLEAEGESARAIVSPRANLRYEVRLGSPKSYYEEWDDSMLYCSCLTKRSLSFWKKGLRHSYEVCQHEAAVLLLWEKQHGAWFFPEPPEIKEARRQAELEKLEAEKRRLEARRAAEERERERRAEQERKKAEQARLKAEKKKKESQKLAAASFFPGDEPAGTYFDLKRALRGAATNQYAVEQAQAILAEGSVSLSDTRLGYAGSGAQMLACQGWVERKDKTCYVRAHLLADGVELLQCSCRSGSYYFYSDSDELCCHKLALLTKLREYIHRENPGDATDRAADAFFAAMDGYTPASAAPAQEEAPREKCVLLTPRLLFESGQLTLSYRIGRSGCKPVLLRSYADFLEAVEERKPFQLGKSLNLDFGAVELTEDSLPRLTFLQRRMSETEVANSQASLGYYSSTLKVKTRDVLAGAMLDRFYELSEGGTVDFSCEKQSDQLLHIGHAAMRVTLYTSRIPLSGPLLGVEIKGKMPVILKGSAGSYMLSADSLSKITREEELALLPFRSASDAAGNIRFRVGKERLAEYYYRVLPQLSQSPYVDLEDSCAEEAEALLPPEPKFHFRLDVDGALGLITCEALVRYGEAEPRALPYTAAAGDYRDLAQESRVLRVLARHFPKLLSARTLHYVPYSDEALFEIQTEALPELERFGLVEGSSAFDRSAPRPMPQLRVGVSVESGLLEIELLSRDMSPEELLGVLESYRQKKRFHRLSSGAFVSLERDSQLDELEALSAGMDFDLEDAVRGGVKVPMYRALYLDSLLEEHDALAANRDRTYRALLKSFATIRDADYEVPDAQAEILRPYQVHGYKWLRTLAAAGFGGILADEMGLGKTLQFISLVQALRDAGSMALCLVVCPASLVYNWQEEFQRFAPRLDAQVLTGPASQRKSRLASLSDGAVCITSYDLLRQDIAEYRKLRFSLMVLDEAQYIKNQKAAMTKAVKAVQAELRFALTGTPIENRLAELWSIFDFLMPGFLYSYPDFSRRLETPIVKQKDAAATARLKQMTAPFILRRLKADVLKDLPAKLEEVRYTRFEDEQRKVYDGQVVRMKQLVAQTDGSGEDKLRIFAELTRIRQICCDPSLLLENYHGGSAKRAACLELIQSAMGGGHRMLVFSQFTSMLALLEEDLNQAGIPYFKLTGATPKEQRLRLVREFNEGTTPVFLISLKAGGTGLNLTGADVVIHYDPWWNLAAQNQATDRAHRIGQKNQVTVYRIIVKDTIEERILALQEAKRDLADAVLSGEGQSLAALSSEELLALLG